MVSLLGPVRLRLDAAEQRAVDVLVECALVSRGEAQEAYAVPDLPDWVVESWQGAGRSLDRQAQPLRELGGRATG